MDATIRIDRRKSTLIFSMPGSTGAVRLAMDKLILPQIGHLASLLCDADRPSDPAPQS